MLRIKNASEAQVRRLLMRVNGYLLRFGRSRIRINAAPFWCITGKIVLSRWEQQTAAKVTGNSPLLRHVANQRKKSTPPWAWQQHNFYARRNIFTVMLASWREDCSGVVESAFQQKETLSAPPVTRKSKHHGGIMGTSVEVCFQSDHKHGPLEPAVAPQRHPEHICEGKSATWFVWKILIWGILVWNHFQIYKGWTSREGRRLLECARLTFT